MKYEYTYNTYGGCVLNLIIYISTLLHEIMLQRETLEVGE